MAYRARSCPFLGGYAFSVSLGTLLGALAALLGCALSFAYARFFGKGLLRARLGERARRFDRFIHDHPFSMTVLIRLLPVGSNLLTNLAAGDCPDAGQVWLEGREIEGLGARELARLRSLRIGLVFQSHHLLPHLGVLENAPLPAMISGDPAAPEHARRLLERVGLAGRLDHRPAQLSGGERQRAAVVRALVNRPALLLADEPTGSLDRRAADALADLLVELNREEGATLVVATHASSLAARMGRTLELLEGRLAPTG